MLPARGDQVFKIPDEDFEAQTFDQMTENQQDQQGQQEEISITEVVMEPGTGAASAEGSKVFWDSSGVWEEWGGNWWKKTSTGWWQRWTEKGSQ